MSLYPKDRLTTFRHPGSNVLSRYSRSKMTPVRLAKRVIGLFVVLGVTSPVSSTNMVNWGFDMPSKQSAADEKSQLDKFKEAARELECDDDEQRFKERLGKLVKAKPSDQSE